MTPRPVLTLARQNVFSDEIKRSKFIALADRVDSPEEALVRLDSLSDPEATHNCWAYRIGEAYRFSDDGEPGGSAGRPILAAIEGQGIDHVLVVVTRYFGGIKLGVGGLVRAYGGTAAECLRTAQRFEIRPTVRLRVLAPFEFVSGVFPLLGEYAIEKVEEDFVAEGLRVLIQIDAEEAEEFQQRLKDLCRGQSRVSAVE